MTSVRSDTICSLSSKKHAPFESQGASPAEIVALLSTIFLPLILLANLIAWPASHFAIDGWLGESAYKAETGLLPFFAGAPIAFLIAGATVAHFAFQASRARIVDALKRE